MAFSRQHYVKFAELLKKISDHKTSEMLAIELLKMFKQDNPRFDSARFLKAAGIESNPRTAPFESRVTESFNKDMKLIPLLPAGMITELGFHGGNPTAEDVNVLASDFESEFDEAENELDRVLSGIVEAAHEADFKDVETAIRQQVSVLRKAIGMFRAGVGRVYKAKMQKLGGK